MSKLLRCVVFGAIVAFIQGCSSGPGIIGPFEGLSGGVPITGRALTSVEAGIGGFEVTVTWPVAPASATATFRYYVLDYSSVASPAWVAQGNALMPLSGDLDSDWDVDVPVSSATTKHTVNILPELAKTYRVVVLVSMTDAGTEYVGSCWFEAKP